MDALRPDAPGPSSTPHRPASYPAHSRCSCSPPWLCAPARFHPACTQQTQPADRETRSTRHTPRSDSPPDRSAPSSPSRCNHRRPPATPAPAKIPPCHCSNTLRPRGSGTACVSPSSKLLRWNRKVRDPAVEPALARAAQKAPRGNSARFLPPQRPQPKTETLDDRPSRNLPHKICADCTRRVKRRQVTPRQHLFRVMLALSPCPDYCTQRPPRRGPEE